MTKFEDRNLRGSVTLQLTDIIRVLVEAVAAFSYVSEPTFESGIIKIRTANKFLESVIDEVNTYECLPYLEDK